MTDIIDLRQEWRDCIESCTNCHHMCIETAAYSLKQGGELAESAHISILYDCIDICQASINSMSRGSHLANRICELCANVCDICAEHCSQFDDLNLDECARICRNCAEQCREMSAVRI